MPTLKRHRTDRLAAVDHEVGADLVRPRVHRLEVEDGAVGPVHVRHADDAHPVVERAQDGVGPRSSLLAVDGQDLGAARARRRLPRVDPRRVLLGQDQHPVAAPEREVAGGHREPVARRRDQRDPVRVGADQSREQLPEPLDLAEPVARRDRPRPAAPVERGLAGRSHPVQLGRQGGGVEVGDLVGDRERLPLRAEGEAHPMYAVSGCPQVSGTTFPSTSRRIIIGHVGTGAASLSGSTLPCVGQ